MTHSYTLLPTSSPLHDSTTTTTTTEKPPSLPNSSSYLTRLTRLRPLTLLKPLIPWLFLPAPKSSNPSTNKPLRRTAYLDGLRGFAAFAVYWQHHHVASHVFSPLEHGFGYHDEPGGPPSNLHFAALPWIRTFFNGGSFAVAVFYVISGYVLSAKPLALMHAGRAEAMAASVGSALARRWARLFLPVFVTTLGFVTALHLFGVWQPLFEVKGSYWEELGSWYEQLRQFSWVFGPGFLLLPYNPHLWSIPVEFRGSVVVYTALLAGAHLRRNVRLATGAALLFYFYWVVDGWYAGLFVGGMMLCDVDCMAERETLPRWMVRCRIERGRQLAWSGLALLGVWLGNVPTKGDLTRTPGWAWISYLKPAVSADNWFFLFFASMLVVAASQRAKWFKFFLETRFVQYLGRISYALYLVHGPIIWTLGDRVYALFGMLGPMRDKTLPGWSNRFPLPNWGVYGIEVDFIVAQMILLPITLWLAEIVTMLVDDTAVRFLQSAYRKGLPREEQ